LLIVQGLDMMQITYSFGRNSDLILEPVLAIKDVLVVSVIVVFISLIASISPAIKASKLDPVEALRSN